MAAGNLMTSSLADSLHVRIISPELDFQTLIVFSPEDTVWQAKQKIISSSCKQLKDGLNYGLYCPSCNNRAGKFLDEERPLKDYPLPGPIGLLEFKYKKRVYKMQINPTKLKKLHSSSSLKKFLEYVKKNDADKITEITNKGLDPNFQDGDKGETPLTTAAALSRPRSVMLALVSGCAYLDFRNQRGMTALHVAAELGNRDAIKTLLDLGASPNYKDARGLTPLFYCVATSNGPAQCIQMLLHDRAEICNRDKNGWTEIHFACMDGKVQHLEHLLFYGADMNAKTTSGDTALHICARFNEEECARTLMFRGADRTIRNNSNEDAVVMARLAGHTRLGDVISNFRPEDVVLYSELPKYNEKRRGTISTATVRNLQRSRSNPQLHKLFSQDSSYASLSSASSYQMFSNSLLFQSTPDARFQTERTTDDQGHTIPADTSSLAMCHSESEPPIPRSLLLLREKTGFGFVLRGAKSRSGNNEKLKFTPSPTCPALQYFDSIEKGSAAERAGLLSGDFLLEVNGENVVSASHDYTVSLIKNSGSQVTMKVVTPKIQSKTNGEVTGSYHPGHGDNSMTRIAPVSLSPSTGSQMKTSLAGLEELEHLDASLDKYENETGTEQLSASGHQGVSVVPVYATINQEWRNNEKTVESAKGSHCTTLYVSYTNSEEDSGQAGMAQGLTQNPGSVDGHSSTKLTGSVISLPEPEPDYDDNIDHQAHQDVSASQTEPEEPLDGSLNGSSFTLMIKQATLNRERRVRERERLDTTVKAESPTGMNSANFNTPGVTPPPPPPPPPIASSGVPELSRHAPANSLSRNVPPEVKKHLEENRKRDEAHAALMAAVLKRRSVLENTDESQVAESIESKLQKSRKIQVIYRGDHSKSELPSSPTHATTNGSEANEVGKSMNGRSCVTSAPGTYKGAITGFSGSQQNKALLPTGVKLRENERNSADGVVPGRVFPRQFNSELKNAAVLEQPSTEALWTNGGRQRLQPQPGSRSGTTDNQMRAHVGYSYRDAADLPQYSQYSDSFPNEDAASTISTLSTLSTLSSLSPSSGSSPPQQLGYLSKSVTPERQSQSHSRIDLSQLPEGVVGVIVPLIPPPDEFSEDGSNDGKQDYSALPVSATLRSVTKMPLGNSMVFPARVKDNQPNDYEFGNSFKRKALEMWSVADVGDFLDSLDYGVYRARFAEQKIDGHRLARLEQNEFLTLGVGAVLHRIKLEREVRKLLQGLGKLHT